MDTEAQRIEQVKQRIRYLLGLLPDGDDCAGTVDGLFKNFEATRRHRGELFADTELAKNIYALTYNKR
jgi:hypothetical protein